MTIRATLYLAAILLIVLGTWYLTRDHYLRIIADKQIEQDRAVHAQLIKNQQTAADHAEKIKTAEEQHAKDQLALNTLSHQLARVQIHIPSGCPVPGSTEAGADPDGRARLLSAATDAAFAELQRGDDEDFARCDQLNSDARQANAAR